MRRRSTRGTHLWAHVSRSRVTRNVEPSTAVGGVKASTAPPAQTRQLAVSTSQPPPALVTCPFGGFSTPDVEESDFSLLRRSGVSCERSHVVLLVELLPSRQRMHSKKPTNRSSSALFICLCCPSSACRKSTFEKLLRPRAAGGAEENEKEKMAKNFNVHFLDKGEESIILC